MDKNRFDQLSRILALRSSRRVAAKQAGIGLAATTLGVVGLELAAAQDPGAASQECRFDLVANIRVDPAEGFTPEPEVLSGVMAFTLGNDGELENGTLTLDDRGARELTGYAAGSSFSARVEFLPGRTLVFVGVGERPIAECSGALDGLLTGSEPGALGDWHASALSGSAETNTGGQQPASGGQQPASGGQTPAQGEALPVATLAPTSAPSIVQPTEATAECAGGLTVCEGECVDLSSDRDHCGACSNACQDPRTCMGGECVCVNVICNAGEALDPASCECICPAGWFDCGDACCDPGSPCRGTVCCLPEGTPCTGADLCCSGTCDFLVGGGTCAPCLGRSCSDAEPCCGGQSCLGSYCGGCHDRATSCTSNDQCCFSECVSGACLSDQGGRCSRNVDCRECYLNGNCTNACLLGLCGGQLLPEIDITAIVKESD